MPVEDHETHDSTRRGAGHKYGCNGKPRRRDGLKVKGGWQTNGWANETGVQRFKIVPDFGSLECRYDNSLADTHCDGCEHRGRGEAYAKTIRQSSMTNEPNPEVSRPDTAEAACTCPRGDGSLSWPCQQHPPEQSGIKLSISVIAPPNPYTDPRQRQGWERGFADRRPYNYPPDVDYMAAYRKGQMDRADHQKRLVDMGPEVAK